MSQEENTSDREQQKYTKPELREEIKDELMESEKGGRSGQWSARKSQQLVQEYERRGGGYIDDEKDEDAKSLDAGPIRTGKPPTVRPRRSTVIR